MLRPSKPVRLLLTKIAPPERRSARSGLLLGSYTGHSNSADRHQAGSRPSRLWHRPPLALPRQYEPRRRPRRGTGPIPHQSASYPRHGPPGSSTWPIRPGRRELLRPSDAQSLSIWSARAAKGTSAQATRKRLPPSINCGPPEKFSASGGASRPRKSATTLPRAYPGPRATFNRPSCKPREARARGGKGSGRSG